MTHDELARDLAAHLRSDKRMTWCDMQLGPSGSPRPDVFAIFKSYSNPCPTAFEVKVSKSDFRADVTTGKWQSYLQFAHGVYFACEEDLISKSDVPAHCGLIVRRASWRIAKRAVLSPVVIPQDACIKLLIDGVEREGPAIRHRSFDSYGAVQKASEKFGRQVGRILSDQQLVQREIESSKYMAERLEKDARLRAELIRKEAADSVEPLRKEICEILGLPADTSGWRLRGEVKKLREAQAEHPAVEKLRVLTISIQSQLDRNGYQDPKTKELEEVDA